MVVGASYCCNPLFGPADNQAEEGLTAIGELSRDPYSLVDSSTVNWLIVIQQWRGSMHSIIPRLLIINS